MDEGTFVEWLKPEGALVQPGEPLFVLESDKAAENVEALDAGVLRLTPDSPRPGDKVKVGQVLGYLAAAGEDPTPLPPPRSGEGEKEPKTKTAKPGQGVGGGVASPRARRVAREL